MVYEEIRSVHYIIPGAPFWLMQSRDSNKRAWNLNHHNKVGVSNQLDTLHNNQPLLTGTLSLEAKFYFPVSITNQKKIDTYHIQKPDLYKLIQFIQEAAIGILYSNDCIVALLSAEKLYDVNPRTEIIFKEIRKKS